MLRSSVIVLAASLLIAAVSAAAPANVPKAAPKMGAGKILTPATTKVAKQQPAQSSVIKDGYYPTCAEALSKIPGYSHTVTAMNNCPNLMAMQTDPTVVKTFFVPSNTAIESIAKFIGLPVNMVIGPMFSGVMCQFLQYHIADQKNMLNTWKVGGSFSTAFPGAMLTVEDVAKPRIKTRQGTVASVERMATCGSSVAFGIDTVLAPFAMPRLG